MRKTLFFAAIALTALTCSCSRTPQEKLASRDAEINKIIAKMTLEEKVEMLHSKTIMSSWGVPRLGIPDMKYADGPFGCREELGEGFVPKGWQTDSATYFPTGSALAATWSGELAYLYGQGMGSEWRARGKDVILGPAMNIQRLPVGGRTYEYLSEDPCLNSVLATGYTRGAQDMGTAVCLKHYAVNNQESDRGTVNVVIDERTLREIYLKPFEAAVKEGGAMSVMTAYNKVNGNYCSENPHLNNDILRDEWGFKGFTVSDWGGTHSTMGATFGGLDVQMTGDEYLGPALVEAVRQGKVDESVVDNKVREILRVRLAVRAIPEDEANIENPSKEFGQNIAYKVAQKSIVLLENDGILPLNKKSVGKIAVIGLNATASTAAGGMGAGVKCPYEITPLKGIISEADGDIEIKYAPAYKNYLGMFGHGRKLDKKYYALKIDEAPDPRMLSEAVKTAADADIVIFFAGTNKSIETEGADRENIDLPLRQNEIIKALARVNPNIVTVVISGGPCDLREIQKYSRAIVQGWWNGMEGGRALAEVLFGKTSPSGKLPFTFPAKLQDSPAYALGSFPQQQAGGDLFGNKFRNDIYAQRGFMPMEGQDEEYSERLLVGYRWFDSMGIEPFYPFGYGLSYVDFDYSDLKTDKGRYKCGDTIKATLNVRNTGDMDADEVVQLYIRRIDSSIEWPEKELKAFSRVTLQAGQVKNVTLEVPVKDLRYWNVESGKWQLENGTVEILVGSSSRDIRLSTKVKI